MTDLSLGLVSDGQSFFFAASLEQSDMATDSGIKTAVLYSLFTDRRAEADDEIPDGTQDRRGHWGDSLLTNENDSEGSRLWLLKRQKATQNTLNRAVDYAREALQWILDDGVANTVDVFGEYVRVGILGLKITIDLINGERFSDVFEVSI